MRQDRRDERRELVLAAVLRVAASQGLAGVSLRHVAAEASASMGQVQHYFGSVADLHLQALEHAVARIDRQVEDAGGATAHDRLRSIALAMLADNAQHALTLSAYSELRGAARTDPRALAVVGEANGRRQAEIADILREAKRHRLLHTLVEPQQEAAVFWMLLLNLAIDVANGVRPRDEAVELMRYHFRRLARTPRISRPRGRS